MSDAVAFVTGRRGEAGGGGTGRKEGRGEAGQGPDSPLSARLFTAATGAAVWAGDS